MSDNECVRFLQETLPCARLRWSGFRKVRSQVCKRLKRRQRELGLNGFDAYAAFMAREPGELKVFDSLCRIPISRFYRDCGVYDFLRECAFPDLIERALTEARTGISIWSAGCASGEEPYSLSIMWRMVFAASHPTLRLSILATDSDEAMIRRAGSARYSPGSLKDLPKSWIQDAFYESNGEFVLRPEYRTGIELERQDIRCSMPEGPFDLVLCRNLVFTYFDDGLQRKMLSGILEKIRPGGFLVVGKHERLPAVVPELVSCTPDLGVFRTKAGVRAATGMS